jgi:hypothetical protein
MNISSAGTISATFGMVDQTFLSPAGFTSQILECVPKPLCKLCPCIFIDYLSICKENPQKIKKDELCGNILWVWILI